MIDKKNQNDKCEFTVHPCSFKVEVKEIKPFYVCAFKSIILDLQIISHCNAKSCIIVKSIPRYGKIYSISPSTLIYKPTRIFLGFDLFQLLIKNEYGEEHTETILIRLKR